LIPALDSVLGKKEKPKDLEAKPRDTSGTMTVRGKMVSPKKLMNELASLSIFQGSDKKDDAVRAMIVESTDRQKNPYLYIRLVFSPESAEATYSIPSEVPNPTLRRLQVAKTLFTLLSLLEAKGVFLPDRNDLYSKTMEALDIASGFSSSDALKMKYDLDRYAGENGVLKAELSKLKEEKDGLGLRLLEFEKKEQQLEERVRQLEGLTDSEIDREIIKWVEEHSGKLNDVQFCSTFAIGAHRLEERLDSLSKKGVIRLV
jgi:hypothetical protein